VQESCLPPKVALQTVLSRRLKLVVQGLYLANRLSMLVTTIMHLHVALQQPISKAEVRMRALDLPSDSSASYPWGQQRLPTRETHRHLVGLHCSCPTGLGQGACLRATTSDMSAATQRCPV
jgi:hypothetical protein